MTTITTEEITAPSDRPLARSKSSPAPRRRARFAGISLVVGGALIVGLGAFDAWLYWRDTRPIADLDTISNWLRREDYATAEMALRERLRRAPHDVEARMMLARSLAGRGDVLSCARELRKVPFWSPRKTEALFREGQSYLERDHARDAEAAWLELIKDDPLHPVPADLFHDACQALLKLYAIEDRWDDAYPVMWAAHDHAAREDRPVLLAMRVRPELERVAPKESIEVIRRYVAADPDDLEALRALARAEQALGQPAEAARHFQECLKRRPDDVRAWRDHVAMLLDQGELESFLALLEKAPKGADIESETWMFRGVAREKAGNWPAAAECFRKAIELNPTVSKYYYRLAVAEERLGLRKEAMAHRQRTKEMNEARGQLPAAYADYFAAQKLDGEAHAQAMAAACKHLGSICETLGWSRAALAWDRLAISPP